MQNFIANGDPNEKIWAKNGHTKNVFELGYFTFWYALESKYIRRKLFKTIKQTCIINDKYTSR